MEDPADLLDYTVLMATNQYGNDLVLIKVPTLGKSMWIHAGDGDMYYQDEELKLHFTHWEVMARG